MSELYRYVPSQAADLLLAQLWARMHEDGDLAVIYSDPSFPLSAMFEASMPPHNDLVYAIDQQGIWFAFWATPLMRGALVTVYVRPDARRQIRTLLTFRRVLRATLLSYGTVLGITREELLPLHLKLGYTVAGRVPGILAGRDGLLVTRVATAKEQQWRESSEPSGAAAAQPAPVQLELPLGRPEHLH